MGGSCARCTAVEKAPGDGASLAPVLDELEIASTDGQEAVDSDGERIQTRVEEQEEDLKVRAGEVLQALEQTLQRGKTASFKEAIQIAKRNEVDPNLIREAEQLLEAYKRDQKRGETDREVDGFFSSPKVD